MRQSWMIAHLAAFVGVSLSSIAVAAGDAPGSSGTVAQAPTASFPIVEPPVSGPPVSDPPVASPPAPSATQAKAPTPQPTPPPAATPPAAPPRMLPVTTPGAHGSHGYTGQTGSSQSGWAFTTTPQYTSPAQDRGHTRSEDAENFRDQWMVALSLATHAPVDLGLELAVETPIRLRFLAGLGYVPSGYLSVITGALVGADALNDESRTLIEDGFESGRAWRLGIGIRPFKNFGAYLDGGFSHLSVSGSIDANEARELTGVRLSTSYKVKSSLSAWFLELGYQGLIADRVLLAFGFGVMRSINSRTSADPTGQPSATESLFDDAATNAADDAIEKYGIIPTLNLRLGFDVI
ncbi:MAG TPA: hypothetical protein VI072_33155 [Polyangiaceae bacterium]